MLASHLFPKSAALALAAVLAWPQPASAQSAGPFASFAGSFRGSGVVIGTNGQRERIACRANAVVGRDGRSMTQNIVCASDSYKFDIRSRAAAEGGRVSGEWEETTRGVSGDLSGSISGGHLSGAVSGGNVNATFSLRNSGSRLAFDLRPQGGDVARVDVNLAR